MTKFQYGQWYQSGSEIFYIYDIDNFQERIWLAPAVHPNHTMLVCQTSILCNMNISKICMNMS